MAGRLASQLGPTFPQVQRLSNTLQLSRGEAFISLLSTPRRQKQMPADRGGAAAVTSCISFGRFIACTETQSNHESLISLCPSMSHISKTFLLASIKGAPAKSRATPIV